MMQTDSILVEGDTVPQPTFRFVVVGEYGDELASAENLKTAEKIARGLMMRGKRCAVLERT